jgi:hypothetical protein
VKFRASRYDSLAFKADAEQQLDVHGPRLLAAALVRAKRKGRRSGLWIVYLYLYHDF